jgi:hypothetical protein
MVLDALGIDFRSFSRNAERKQHVDNRSVPRSHARSQFCPSSVKKTPR